MVGEMPVRVWLDFLDVFSPSGADMDESIILFLSWKE
jgi:hypothetical protein